ncbi:MAG: tetratricopeptide repeat protein [Planctomycetes bacterium]|nr:tetratricopeptide repeat protein [Planctomycetota bacterium]
MFSILGVFQQGHKYDLRDFAGAIQDYSKAIELNLNDAKIYYRRGIAKEILEDTRGALADYSKEGELGNSMAYEAIKRIQKGNE